MSERGALGLSPTFEDFQSPTRKLFRFAEFTTQLMDPREFE